MKKMLNKELCKKCWKPLNEAHESLDASYERFGWFKFDEKQWKNGKVRCPAKYTEKGESPFRNKIDNPPGKCPYFLEQLI